MIPRLASAVLVIFATKAAAMGGELTPRQFLDICRSSSIAGAAEKGDKLGWERVPEDAAWRRAFGSFNKGSTAEAVGWRRSPNSKAGHLNFWVSRGTVRSRNCQFMAPSAPGFREALIAAYGAPDSDETTPIGTLASWKQGSSFIVYQTLPTLVSVTIAVGD